MSNDEVKCKNCKHWCGASPTVWDISDLGLFRCDAAEETWNLREKIKDKLDEDDYMFQEGNYHKLMLEVGKEAQFAVSDASSYSATLFTDADFFCARFEEKDA